MKLFTASLLFSFLPLAMNSFSATLNLSTGLDSTNTLITSGNVADAHWTVVGDGAARTVFPDNIDFVSAVEPWVPNGPNSDWIALNPLSRKNGLHISRSVMTKTGASSPMSPGRPSGSIA